MTYRERRERRAERLREWAAKRTAKSTAAFSGARRLADAIPFGQPILVGYHSERRARRDAERIRSGIGQGIEHQRKAAEMSSRADEIERQADRAIYSDDANAVEALEARIADLEAKRTRIKAINAQIRKGPGYEARIVPPLTPKEREDLLMVAQFQPYYKPESNGFPPYVLQNLSGNITRQRARLAQLQQRAQVAEVLTVERAAE